MREIKVSLGLDEFKKLVKGEEYMVTVKPLPSGLVTERRINEVFKVKIILSDIGFQSMKEAVFEAITKKTIG